MKEKILLTISLLASNRPDTLKMCLDSLAPIRAAISSELIIVDTSGKQEIREILEEYTDKIVPFTWCNDFAKARNAGLERAKGEWFLFIDDDEWFVDVKELIRFFTEDYHEICGYGTYIVRSFLDEERVEYHDAHLSRFFKIVEGVHFEGCIHEFVTPVYGNCAKLNALVEHSGYVYQTEEQCLAHFQRNQPLVLQMIEQEPENLKAYSQLTQEYYTIDDFEGVYESGKKGLEVVSQIDFSKNVSHRDFVVKDSKMIGTFYIAIIEGLLHLKRYQECLDWCDAARKDERNSRLCRAAVDINYGDVLYRLERYVQAEDSIKRYLQEADEIVKNEEQYYKESQALLVANAFLPHQIIRAYSILICCALKQGRIEVLERYVEKLCWSEPKVFVYEGIGKVILEAFVVYPEKEVFTQVLKKMVSQKALQQELYESLKAWQKEKRNGWEEIVEVLSGLPVTNWYLLYIQAQTGRHQEDVAKHIQNLSMDEWRELLRDLVRAVQWAEVLKVEAYLKESSLIYDDKFAFLQMALAEIQLVFDETLIEKEALEEAFLMYATKTLSFYRDVMELPPAAQAAIGIQELLAVQDRAIDIQGWKRIVNIYPILKHPIDKYIEVCNKRVNAQMEHLKLQIVGQVLQLVDEGKKEEGLQILEQLQAMMPQDKDIIDLVQELR